MDFVILDEKTYIIRAMIAADETILLTLVGGPSSRVYVLRAQMRWQDMHDAWRPVRIQDFFEAEEPTAEPQPR